MRDSLGYEISSVDWFPEQTDLWLKFVEKNCPQAYVTLYPDVEPITDAWSSGKFTCLLAERQSPNLIYIDTDSIIFKDLGFIFDMMKDCRIGMINKTAQGGSYLISVKRTCPMSKEAAELLGMEEVPPNRAGGMMTFKGFDEMQEFVKGWYDMHFNPAIEVFKKNPRRWKSWQEIALSYWTAVWQKKTGNKIWDIPVEVHGNLAAGNPMFNHVDLKPTIVHYHTFPYLAKSPYSGCLAGTEKRLKKMRCPTDSVKARIFTTCRY